MQPTPERYKFDDLVWSDIAESSAERDFVGYLYHFPAGNYADHAWSKIGNLAAKSDELPSNQSARFYIALERIALLADEGNAEACFLLGVAYNSDRAVQKDPAQSETYYTRGALLGHLSCQYNLANLYLSTKSRELDAINIIDKLTAEGFIEALAARGRMKLDGKYVPVSIIEGLADLRDAERNGSGYASYVLANLHFDSRNVYADINLGIEYLRATYVRQYEQAGYDLATYMLDGKFGLDNTPGAIDLLCGLADKGYPDAQVKAGRALIDALPPYRDEARGLHYLRRGALLDDGWAQLNMSHFFAMGKIVPANAREALKWLKRATANGEPEAQYRLARHIKEKEKSNSSRQIEANELMRSAARSGHALAQFSVGLAIYLNNEASPEDLLEAIKWFQVSGTQGLHRSWALLGEIARKSGKEPKEVCRLYKKAADAGDAHGQYFYGISHLDGYCETSNLAEGVYWVSLAAEAGYETAQYRLGLCLLNGDGVERNPVEAARWIAAAVEQGVANAEFVLGRMYLRGDGVKRDPDQARRLIERSAAGGCEEAKKWLVIDHGVIPLKQLES